MLRGALPHAPFRDRHGLGLRLGRGTVHPRTDPPLGTARGERGRETLGETPPVVLRGGSGLSLPPNAVPHARRNRDRAAVRAARGRFALRGRVVVAENVQHFGEGGRLEPACAASCAEQLAAMLEKPQHPGKIRHALAETLLIKGDLDEAARTLRDHLAENPDNGREVIMLVRPFIDPL